MMNVNLRLARDRRRVDILLHGRMFECAAIEKGLIVIE